MFCDPSSLVKYILPKKKQESFFDIASTFFFRSFNSFSTATCFVLFELILLLKPNSLLSRLVFFTKSTISLLFAKFGCFSLAAKCSAVNLLDFGIVIKLS